MGGQEGSRGYLYQAIAAVIESLSDNGWDKIYLEFPSENDKVDIALEANERIVKVIQVKSTNSSFRKNTVVSWLNELLDDHVDARCVHMCLIGSCTAGVTEFFNSISKYKANRMDKTAKDSLVSFNCSKIDGVDVGYKVLPFDLDNLKRISRDMLHEYISRDGIVECFDKLDFLVDAMINEQMLSSIIGSGIDRDSFEDALNKKIELLSRQYKTNRTSVGIQSFPRGAEHLIEDVDEYCCLLKYFDNRYLKEGYSWNKNVYGDLEKFVENKLKTNLKYQVFLESHLSIAFSFGRLCDGKSRIDMLPVQKSEDKGVVLWDIDESTSVDFDWDVDYIPINADAFETVLVLNVTHNIYDDVLDYLNESGIQVSMIINCKPKDKEASSILIKNGTHAFLLAESVYKAQAKRSTDERRSIIHIFSAAPNGFMFFLGKKSRGFGKCILYEYDFEQKRTCTYYPSISFLN